ncbi:MAG TPA: hypothetical protein VL098_12710 [Flavipsychrobacter sp.]|nr:hypothetical protein [Flavipsychrobacter sp.]
MSDLGINLNNTSYGQKDYMAENTTTPAATGPSIWDSIFSNLGPTLNGVANVVAAGKGQQQYVQPTNSILPTQNPQNKNWLIIGAAVLLLVLVGVFAFRK